jgi:hypothetical protein
VDTLIGGCVWVINPKGGLGVVTYKVSENGPRKKEGGMEAALGWQLTSQTAFELFCFCI